MCFRQIELPNFDHYLPTSYQVFEQQDINANIQEDTISLPVIATPIENDTIDKVLQLRHGVRKTTRIFGWILIFIIRTFVRCSHKNPKFENGYIISHFQHLYETLSNDEPPSIVLSSKSNLWNYTKYDNIPPVHILHKIDNDMLRFFLIYFDQMIHLGTIKKTIINGSLDNRPNNIQSLRPFYDESTRLIRVHGRLKDCGSVESPWQRFLHKKSKFITKVIYDYLGLHYCTGIKYTVYHSRLVY